MVFIPINTLLPQRRPPVAKGIGVAVAVLSIRALTNVPSRIHRTTSSPARWRVCQTSRLVFTLRRAPPTPSLPNRAGGEGRERVRHATGAGPGEIGARHRRHGLAGPAGHAAAPASAIRSSCRPHLRSTRGTRIVCGPKVPAISRSRTPLRSPVPPRSCVPGGRPERSLLFAARIVSMTSRTRLRTPSAGGSVQSPLRNGAARTVPVRAAVALSSSAVPAFVRSCFNPMRFRRSPFSIYPEAGPARRAAIAGRQGDRFDGL